MPTYRSELTPKARKQIRALDATVRRRIEAAIVKLETVPFPPGVKAMQGTDEPTFRVKVGDWRILYTVDAGVLLVLVVSVGPRREIYRT